LLFVQRCQQNLLGLNKLISGSGTSSSSSSSSSSSTTSKAKAKVKTEMADWAKKLYSQALQLPNSQTPNFLTALCNLVETMSKDVQKLK
jgi:hypothetical protein